MFSLDQNLKDNTEGKIKRKKMDESEYENVIYVIRLETKVKRTPRTIVKGKDIEVTVVLSKKMEPLNYSINNI